MGMISVLIGVLIIVVKLIFLDGGGRPRDYGSFLGGVRGEKAHG
jgi:hypothetical protein